MAILISVKPRWVKDILEGKKTIELRKAFPKDYEGKIYIYCCEDSKEYLFFNGTTCYFKSKKDHDFTKESLFNLNPLNGRIVACFECNNVDETFYEKAQYDCTLPYYASCACLTENELWEYAHNNTFYAIEITNLNKYIYKKLEDFLIPCHFYATRVDDGAKVLITSKVCLRAPQNYCYVEEQDETD